MDLVLNRSKPLRWWSQTRLMGLCTYRYHAPHLLRHEAGSVLKAAPFPLIIFARDFKSTLSLTLTTLRSFFTFPPSVDTRVAVCFLTTLLE